MILKKWFKRFVCGRVGHSKYGAMRIIGKIDHSSGRIIPAPEYDTEYRCVRCWGKVKFNYEKRPHVYVNSGYYEVPE